MAALTQLATLPSFYGPEAHRDSGHTGCPRQRRNLSFTPSSPAPLPSHLAHMLKDGVFITPSARDRVYWETLKWTDRAALIPSRPRREPFLRRASSCSTKPLPP